jgi:MinD superfamily P-loop ATPase containing an inserted ferredoxin domain
MKEVAIVSGKGGTGKTSVTGSFIVLAREDKLDIAFADCDVDAPNLHLLFKSELMDREEYHGSRAAEIKEEECIECDICVDNCRFGAIENYKVDPILCEGCGVCNLVCPSDAVWMRDRISGYIFTSKTDYGPMVHGLLRAGEESSGKIVAEIRSKSRTIAERDDRGLIMIDATAGIGCQVIASLSGVNIALIVTEPTKSGLHDLERIIGLVKHFEITPLVCINKYDLNEDMAEEIEDYCEKNELGILKKIPFDRSVEGAINAGIPVVKYDENCEASKALIEMWGEFSEYL